MRDECAMKDFSHDSSPLVQHIATKMRKSTIKWFVFEKWRDIIPNMAELDQQDLKILRHLQKDTSSSIDVLADEIGLSRNACWRRIRRLEADGVISRKVAILNAEALDLDLLVHVMVRIHNHDPKWIDQFKSTIQSMREIVGAYRMSGDLDYLLKVRVRDVKAFDRFYQRLITKVPMSEVSSSFVMEDIKDTTALPI